MIVPSIDLQGGNAVQLVGGAALAIDGGDPRAWMERFRTVGDVAVVDLDAALGRGDNRAAIEELCRMGRCRVGGGIRDEARALRWLDAGAAQVVIGTAAERALLRRLPRERVVVALDARDGEVVVEGWRRRTGRSIEERLAELRDDAGGFLVTFVEREGRLRGTDLERAARLAEAAGDARLTIAGGVTTAEEIAALDRLGVEAQVGMALYAGSLPLADAFAAPLVSDHPDGLWATVVVDEGERALGLAWSDRASLAAALETRRGVYHSRTRGTWIKGATSGATQELLAVDVDCDRDALRFTVRQAGAGFCHLQRASCWGPARGLARLERALAARAAAAPAGSYVARLLDDPALLAAKLREEAAELAAPDADVVHEAADVLFFTLARLRAAGARLGDVEAELDRRALCVSRRAGDAKEVRP